jgi:enoyl-CoA hydratase
LPAGGVGGEKVEFSLAGAVLHLRLHRSTSMSGPFFHLDLKEDTRVLRLLSKDGTNRLTRECVMSLQGIVQSLRSEARPLLLAGNEKFFSAGADLGEIAALGAPEAYEFSKRGQELMQCLEEFPARVYAVVSGYCMGGGLDLALACQRRIAAPNAVFGHRGAALGLITGWGGTQRLPRLVSKANALQMLVAAETISAQRAFALGLVDAVAEDPLAEAILWIRTGRLSRNPGRPPI